MKFVSGTAVQLKDGVSLPDSDVSFEGWSGKVISVHPEEGILEMELDGKTLSTLTDEYLLQCVEDNVDPLKIYFRVEDMQQGDTAEKTRELEAQQESTIERMTHLDPFGKWEEDYDMQINRWFRNFARSKEFSELSQDQQEESSQIVHSFSNTMWEFYGVNPAHWEELDVESCLLNEVPENVVAPQPVFNHYGEVLIAFFQFLHTRKYLPTLLLQETIEEAMEEIPKLAADRTRWTIAKEFAMKQLEGTVKAEEEFKVGGTWEIKTGNAFLNGI